MTGELHAKIHLVLLLFWGIMIPAALFIGWAESVIYVSLVSIYANMATHWSAYAGARAERKQEE